MKDGEVQIERPDLWVVQSGRTGASMFDVVTRPQRGDALAGDGEFTDELNEFAVGRLRAQHGSHKWDHPGGEAIPVAVQRAQFGLEKRCAQDVFARAEEA